eukprot:Hpha_TRINITY_DN15763_c0_g1::TRINITY_DN15763_c0_g1_i1::g.36937::m.36937/K07151/STT3; dolichyl-diphosphooligosaccharide--protein glycosyltransferase
MSMQWHALGWAFAAWLAYSFRLHAVHVYGAVIHEFDPWFNFRATEYLAENGATRFFEWFDHKSWYPLGRPVGTTIYPGMQFTAVGIWKVLEAIGQPMSLNDVCVYMPAWFGVIATLFLGLLAKECTGDDTVAVVSAVIMSVIPAHMMRSPAGKFDNESVAIPAMMALFYFWVRSLRSPSSWPIGAVAGISYMYMVASWGGYIFPVNLIAVHVLISILTARDSPKLRRSYVLFYLVGTSGAVRVPPVGWAPLRSLEQMLPLFCFFTVLVMSMCETIAARSKKRMKPQELAEMKLKAMGLAVVGMAVVGVALMPTGYFGPLSSRVRGLFVRHTRTGNPLVDSVAEHRATSPRAYYQYLHITSYLSLVGFAIGVIRLRAKDAGVFALVYALVAFYFSMKMNRLIILCGPIASLLGGLAVVHGSKWSWGQIREFMDSIQNPQPPAPQQPPAPASAQKKKAKQQQQEKKDEDITFAQALNELDTEFKFQRGAAFFLAMAAFVLTPAFFFHCDFMAKVVAQPSIMRMRRSPEGVTIIDDYREAYWWLRDSTPEDSRVLAWWDYGYQIAGVGNRTTLADGNTWNHEHIALVGRCLISPEKDAHRIIRHLADYVLIWAGGDGDDLAKSPHMARIANSVYSSLCPDDPTCAAFGFEDRERQVPTEMMGGSLLYKLHGNGLLKDVEVDGTLFEDVYKSSHGLVRIYKVLNVSKESKDWVADPANRLCDAPGSWYCSGQYPPALQPILKESRSFAQLEDFNRRSDASAEEYQREYHKRMSRDN